MLRSRKRLLTVMSVLAAGKFCANVCEGKTKLKRARASVSAQPFALNQTFGCESGEGPKRSSFLFAVICASD
jgi:hypothetical protein